MNILIFYKTFNYFDKILHIFGSFSYSVLIFSIPLTKGYFQGARDTFIFIFILFIGTLIGVINEIGEFLCDLIFKTTNQNGLIDTDLDMICNMLGGSLAGIFVASESKSLEMGDIMIFIYNCYGGTYSSSLASAVHLKKLPLI